MKTTVREFVHLLLDQPDMDRELRVQGQAPVVLAGEDTPYVNVVGSPYEDLDSEESRGRSRGRRSPNQRRKT